MGEFQAVSRSNFSGAVHMEMSRDDLLERMLCSMAEVCGEDLRRGTLSDDEVQRVTWATRALAETPLFVDDTPGLSALDIDAKARCLHKRYGLELVVIDYLQLIWCGGMLRSGPGNGASARGTCRHWPSWPLLCLNLSRHAVPGPQ